MDLGLTNRIALVCGGSSGLGYAVAERFLAEGAQVALNGRDPARLDAAVHRLERPSARVRPFPADVSDPEACAELVQRVHRAMGGPDIVLCNSGGPPAGPFASHTATAWQQALDSNLLSAVHLARAAVPGMRERRWGRILCLTSIAAKQPVAGLVLSTAARAGVLGFAKALADEVAADGVTVNVLCPGLFATDRLVSLADTRARAAGRTSEAIMTEMAEAIPMKRIGAPDEFAAVAVFLASEPARYLTGTAISVDGGQWRGIL
jgi:3-oxoacyl-[acyl-carrier protein] reductase